MIGFCLYSRKLLQISNIEFSYCILVTIWLNTMYAMFCLQNLTVSLRSDEKKEICEVAIFSVRDLVGFAGFVQRVN